MPTSCVALGNSFKLSGPEFSQEMRGQDEFIVESLPGLKLFDSATLL